MPKSINNYVQFIIQGSNVGLLGLTAVKTGIMTARVGDAANQKPQTDQVV